jgi:hypothetical protein
MRIEEHDNDSRMGKKCASAKVFAGEDENTESAVLLAIHEYHGDNCERIIE